jgi:formyl-CoA transferase
LHRPETTQAQSARDSGEAGPLNGIRVIELGSFIAAPTAGRLLADFGAEVIKVEKPGKGDQVRGWGLRRGSNSMLWRTLGRNKKSVTIDLHRPEGRGLVKELIRHSHILLENFRPGTLEKWGLGPAVLADVNSRLITVRISGFGQWGPYADRAGFGAVAEAMGGIRYLTGNPDRPPTRVGVSLGDSLAGLHAVVGALVALVAQLRGGDAQSTRGGGETVDVALYEAVFSVMESLVPDYSAYGFVRERTGSILDSVAPSNIYKCAGGRWIVVAGNSDSLFRRLMSAIGRNDLADDPELQNNAGRVRHRVRIDEAISEETEKRSLEAVMEILVAAGVPAGPIYSSADMVADPHFIARKMLEVHPVEVEPGREEEVLFPSVVPKLTNSPGAVKWLGPSLGAHTDEILTSVLGMKPAEIAVLRDAGVV